MRAPTTLGLAALLLLALGVLLLRGRIGRRRS